MSSTIGLVRALYALIVLLSGDVPIPCVAINLRPPDASSELQSGALDEEDEKELIERLVSSTREQSKALEQLQLRLYGTTIADELNSKAQEEIARPAAARKIQPANKFASKHVSPESMNREEASVEDILNASLSAQQDPYFFPSPSSNTQTAPPTIGVWGAGGAAPQLVVPICGALMLMACACLALQEVSPSENSETRSRISTSAKVDAIFSACDQDRDGFISYNELVWLARQSDANSARRVTMEWFRDLCRPLGADPGRGLDKQEFRRSYYLLGSDLEKDYLLFQEQKEREATVQVGGSLCSSQEPSGATAATSSAGASSTP